MMKSFSLSEPIATIFGHGQGMGFVSDSPIESAFVGLEKRTAAFEAGQLAPDTTTDLFGFFARPLRYVGTVDGSQMIFYIGASDADLFGQKHYWQSMIWMSETKIFSMYSHNAGRDWNFVNGKWK